MRSDFRPLLVFARCARAAVPDLSILCACHEVAVAGLACEAERQDRHDAAGRRIYRD
jgi:hypothetical protein